MLDFNKVTTYQDMDYKKLSEVCSSCTACPLSETRNKVVIGSGPVPCDLMVIGEGPGEQEDEQGLPFVGKAGKLLTKILESVQINREKDIYIANIVKCRPPNNRNPLPDEVTACKDYLIRQIQLIKPKIIIVLGSPSLKTVLGDSLSITKARGNWSQAKVDYMDDTLYIMPTFHPSYLLRNASKEVNSPKWLTWQDMKEVKTALEYYTAKDVHS